MPGVFFHRSFIPLSASIALSAACCLLFVGYGNRARAADDAAQFLDAMRKRGMHDLALDYLSYAATSSLASDEFKGRIPYERSVTLVNKWRETRGATKKQRIVGQIRSEIDTFAANNPDSPLTAVARSELATLLTATAMQSLAEAENKADGDASAARNTARSNLEEARELQTTVEASIVQQLADYPKVLDPKTQGDMIEQRRELRAKLSQVRVLNAYALHQLAQTHAEDSEPFKKLNQQAADELQALYDKYGSFLVGFYARVYQGECYLDLKKYKEASGCFEDIIVQGGENPSVTSLVTKALALQAECNIATEQYDTVIAKSSEWIKRAPSQRTNGPEWLMLKFQLAEALRLKAELPDTKDSEGKKLLSQTRDLYDAVAKRPNDYQDTARERMATLFGAAGSADRREVKTFTEALQAAKDALNSMTAARQALPAAEANNPAAANALKKQEETGYADAIHYLDTAQQLIDDDTPVAELNESRWLMSWLWWQDEQFYRSATMASFLTRSYPEDPTAMNAAQVALASYDKLFQQTTEAGGDASAEAAKLKQLAAFITKRWSSTALADTAFGVLMNFSIRDQQFDAALDLIQQLDPSRQAAYQAKVGNAIWEAQLRAAGDKNSTVDRQALRSQATELLTTSFETLQNDSSTAATLAASSLYLAQARIDKGEFAEAITLLENPKAGPLALLKTNNPVASRPAYAMEAYKAALRSYVSVVPPQTDKAVGTMQQLEQVVKATQGGGDQLTRVYLGLGVQLQQQIEALQGAGKSEEAKRVSEAFVAFLEKLSERGTSDPAVQRWIAQTYYRLAEGLEGDATAADVRTSYYEKASTSFKALMDAPRPEGENPNVMLALKMQYGQTLRQAGKYAEAMQQFEEILAEKESMPDVQIAAAYTLQAWGAADQAEKLQEAVMGSGPKNDKGKSIVWGWNYLSKFASSVARQRPELKDKYQDIFYEAWLNTARVYELRAAKANDAEKAKLLDKARSVVRSMANNYPAMLKTPRGQDFERLMREIQKAEGKRPTGLKEFDD